MFRRMDDDVLIITLRFGTTRSCKVVYFKRKKRNSSGKHIDPSEDTRIDKIRKPPSTSFRRLTQPLVQMPLKIIPSCEQETAPRTTITWVWNSMPLSIAFVGNPQMSIHVSLLGCLHVAAAISWALDGRLMRFLVLPVNTALVLGVQIGSPVGARSATHVSLCCLEKVLSQAEQA
jgi:hypothetical protein